jgi:hypothetical protein
MSQPNLTAVISPSSLKAGTSTPAVTDDLTFTIFEQDVPAFTEAELDRLYHSAYASMAHWRVYGGAEQASTFIARNNDSIVDLLLFRIEGARSVVLNEMIVVDNAMVNRFAKTIFARYPSVRFVAFNAVRANVSRTTSNSHGHGHNQIHHHHGAAGSAGAMPYPYQVVNHSEDIVVPLPSTVDDYLARFGKATRKNIKQHVARAQRDLSGFAFQVVCGADIVEEDLRAIVSLNHARMRDKGKVSYLDEAETQRLLRIARDRGAIATIRIDGRICAGAIYALYGSSYFSYVNAHDPQFDSYRLGTVSCYLTICDCIHRGGKEFHFLWGRYAYKYMLQGEHRDLSRVLVYRSRSALVRHAAIAARSAVNAASHRAKYWILEPERQNHPVVRAVVNAVKKIRRMGDRPA